MTARLLDLSTLNHEQLAAVLATEGPVLVLAGAGSGKTRVITYRLARLIEQGVSPKNILCVTFTNKAAWEMRLRARALVGGSLKGCTMSTFHALGVKILKEYPEPAGLRAGFSISDSADQLGTLRRILRDLRIDDRRFDVKRIMAAITKAKNGGLDAEAFRDAGTRVFALLRGLDLPDDDYLFATREAYARYEVTLRAQNVVDFDDLLLLTQRVLEREAHLLARLRARWTYLQVDEYQDTNGAQLALMRLLAGDRKNLCVVGDDDQSIYGWRGADIANILSFAQHFPGARVVKLETNYRSTAQILNVANAIIEQNTGRHDKRLRAAAGHGERVRVVVADDEDREAEMVAQAVSDEIARGTTPNEVAVLFRSNVQSRPIELAMRTLGVPYRVSGGMDLFDKKEIKDFIAYLRYVDNPDDEQSLRRIVNFPPRGIGDKAITTVDDWARTQGLPLAAGLDRADEIVGLSGKSADAIATFRALIGEHRKLLGKRKASTIARKLLDAIGLEAQLLASSDSATVAARRVDNVREIIRQLERWESRQKTKSRIAESRSTGNSGEVADDDDEDEDLFEDAGGEATLGAFLADLALGAREDSKDDKKDKDAQVVLSTIHASKGLEWKHVYLVGWEEETLPHARTVEGDGDVEEERRLAYVAVTRARAHLTVSWCRTRARYGKLVPRDRSRFLEGLPDDDFEWLDGEMRARTEDEKKAVVDACRAQIRAKLGLG